MSDAPSPAPSAERVAPWDLHPSLTAERLAAAARLLARGRQDAVASADPWAGDDAWSIGCRAYAFSKHQLTRAAESGRYPWLGILDGTHHFVFLIDGVPVRFFRGDAEDPGKRTLRQQESEAEQLALALGAVDADGLMFRLAVETGEDGAIGRLVFLALRGEEGHVECFWPVPLEASTTVQDRPSQRAARRPLAQLSLSAAVKPVAARTQRASPTMAAAEVSPPQLF